LRKPSPHRTVLAAALTAAALGGVGAYAATGAGESTSAPRALSVAPGPGRLTRANGLDGTGAVPVFSLANGDAVDLLASAGVRCLVRRDPSGRVVGESCATDAASAAGRGIAVSDECGASGRNLMEITGLAPQGTSEVRLNSSDGVSRSTLVMDGAFKFDGVNPRPGGPYPTGVQWLGAAGSDRGAAGLPVAGDEFCLPAE